MNDITSLIREAQSMVTMLWLVTARIIDDGKLPRLKAERWGKPSKNWTYAHRCSFIVKNRICFVVMLVYQIFDFDVRNLYFF